MNDDDGCSLIRLLLHDNRARDKKGVCTVLYSHSVCRWLYLGRVSSFSRPVVIDN